MHLIKTRRAVGKHLSDEVTALIMRSHRIPNNARTSVVSALRLAGQYPGDDVPDLTAMIAPFNHCTQECVFRPSPILTCAHTTRSPNAIQHANYFPLPSTLHPSHTTPVILHVTELSDCFVDVIFLPPSRVSKIYQ